METNTTQIDKIMHLFNRKRRTNNEVTLPMLPRQKKLLVCYAK
jgi:hypothetical protein